MPRNEDIHIYFEEGELVNKYLRRLEKGIKQEKPPIFVIEDDSDTYTVDDINMKGYTYCDSCQLDILHFCPKCGSLDVNGLPTEFTCSHCINTFCQGSMLYEHKKMCSNEVVKANKQPTLVTTYGLAECPFCKVLQKKDYLYEHLKTCGERYSSPHTSTPVAITFNIVKAFGTPYACHSCNLGFSDLDIYRQHMTHHKVNIVRNKITSNFMPIKSSVPVDTPSPPRILNTPAAPVEAQKLNLTVDPRCTYSILSQNNPNRKTYGRSKTAYTSKGMNSLASSSIQ